jgi:hypothetical protein
MKRRTLTTLAVITAAVCALGLGTVGLHALLGHSADAWAAAVEAASTVALVTITGWYSYLTLKLVEAQKSAPRWAAWEASLRDLSRFMARNHQAFWTATAFFPVDITARPPMLNDVIASRDAMRDVRDALLEFVGVLPKSVAGPALGVAAHVLNAETELQVLAAALLDETEAGLAEGRSWTWQGAETAHLASDDPERSEAWSDILSGRRTAEAGERWDELSLSLDRQLGE